MITQGDRILLCRMSQDSPDPGRWTLPGGGIDFGESPEDALRRELLEETNLRVEPVKLLTVDSQLFNHPDRSVHVIRILYSARVLSGSLRSESSGTTDLCAWISKPELERLPMVAVARLGVRFGFEGRV